MKNYSAIVAVSQTGVIGDSQTNSLVWSIPSDMKHFRKKTTGKTVIMGSRTFDSIGRALPNRRNIVITRDANRAADLVENHGIDKCYWSFDFAATAEADTAVVIGGQRIYWAAFVNQNPPTELHVTIVDKAFDGDVYFPIDGNTMKHRDLIIVPGGREYEAVERSEWMTENDLPFQFVTFNLKEAR